MGALFNFSFRLGLFIRFGITILSLSVLILSCSTARRQPVAEYPDSHRAAKTLDGPPANTIEQRILDQYHHWKGTRHRLGGTGREGIDCSGFVKAVYRDAFNISLPRTTITQVHGTGVLPLTFFRRGLAASSAG